ncbi:ewing's tumor-associated antigen 1 isoform X1 [Arapaima gigas]
MSGQGQECDSPGPSRRPCKDRENKQKPNKLSKNFRQTQKSPSVESSYDREKDFKTPKRHARTRLNGLSNADSPNNDSELQQDIIWDATSPTPHRNGKFFCSIKKPSKNAGIVDISEIVNRIAPKVIPYLLHQPSVPESNLLQWIGDTAIPCTPEARHHRTRKFARQNCVEDLKKLAKQFDINMIQQDKEQVEQTTKQDTEDAGDVDSCNTNLALSVNKLESINKESVVNVQNTKGALDPKPTEFEIDDNLDALFDGPTQPISGRFSQNTPVESQDTNVATVTVSAGFAAGKEVNVNPTNTPTILSGYVNKNEDIPKTPVVTHEFDDDWDDDLLDDSFVLELSLNPDLIAAPVHCSTQIDMNTDENAVAKSIRPSATGSVTAQRQHRPDSLLVSGSVAGFQGKNEKSKNRSTFRLEANSHFQTKGKFSEGLAVKSHCGIVKQHGQSQSNPANRACCVAPLNQSNNANQHISNGLQENTAQKLFSKESSSSAMSNTCSTLVAQTLNQGWKDSKDKDEAKASEDQKIYKEVSDEDLNSFFAPDSLWDDGDDDDLLCQLCDDVERLSENQEQGSATVISSCEEQNTLKTVPHSTPLPSGGEARRGNQMQMTNSIQHKPVLSSDPARVNVPTSCSTQTAGKMTASVPDQKSSTSNFGHRPAFTSREPSVSVRGPYKFTPAPSTSVVGTSACGPAASLRDNEKRASSLTLSRNTLENRHTSFKRHLSDPLVPINKVFVPSRGTAKCTEEEIERKKQQAMARRRLRMQAAQKLGPPT